MFNRKINIEIKESMLILVRKIQKFQTSIEELDLLTNRMRVSEDLVRELRKKVKDLEANLTGRTVQCETCGCLLPKRLVFKSDSVIIHSLTGEVIKETYFCHKCKPKKK